MAAPPLEAGAVQDTVTPPSVRAVAVTVVGAPGTVEGTTEAEASEAAPEPMALVAWAVKV